MIADRTRTRPRARVPFLGHEVAEYAIGAMLIAVGIHLSGSGATTQAVFIVTGAALVALGALTAAPLGVVRIVSRSLHHAGDAVVIAGLVLSPLASIAHPSVLAIVCAESIALVLLRMERWTRYDEAPRLAPVPASPADRGPLSRAARSGGEAAAVAAALAPVAARAARLGARRLGLAAGAARRAGRAAAARRSDQN